MKVQTFNQAPNQKIKQPRRKRTKAITAGVATYVGFRVAAGFAGMKQLKRLIEHSKALSEAELSENIRGVRSTVKDTGLGEKNLKIFRLTEKNYIDRFKKQRAGIKPGSYFDKLTKIMNKIHPTNIIIAGKNAAFYRKANKIFIPQKGLDIAMLHELGHAMNYNFSATWKAIQKTKIIRITLPLVTIAALFTNTKKEKPKNEQTVFNKVTHFMKYNAGKLSFLLFLPTLMEEAKASMRAKAFANKYLNPTLAAKILKSNRVAYSTYALGALSASAGLAAAVKVEDLICKPKQKS